MYPVISTDYLASPPENMITSQVVRLREELEKKPNSAKLMALLSIELSTNSSDEEDSMNEALLMARKSILMCDIRPIGYYALSIASAEHCECMEALQMVAKLWTASCSMTLAGLGIALVRLLVEPRTAEGRQRKIVISSSLHPTKRGLNKEEEKLYARINDTLAEAWTETKTTSASIVKLAQADFRLGRFFRKMEPCNMYGPTSVHHYSRVIATLPADNSLVAKAQFWLATQTGDMIDKCPPEYIVDLYSTFAARFDALLVGKLDYRTPQKLRQLVDSSNLLKNDDKWSFAADLGCGTGLSGEAFRNCVENLTGVDLSPEMIERAKARGCYDDLVVGDVVSILHNEDTFNLVFSCDVFVYIGDLTEVMGAACKALKRDGIFAFSTEHLDVNDTQPFRLQASARFAHKKSYIESLAISLGYRIVKSEISPLRKNAGADVQGLLFVMTKA